jgi:DNA-binding YbaB/EbfC family protein
MSMPDFKGLLETAQRIQTEVARIREELAGKTVTGETGGGLVRCVANGKGEIVALTIDPTLLASPQGDKRMIEDLTVGAVNLALERARELAQSELARVTGGLPLPPGLFGG